MSRKTKTAQEQLTQFDEEKKKLEDKMREIVRTKPVRVQERTRRNDETKELLDIRRKTPSAAARRRHARRAD
jgi:hypothetical protein